MSYLAVSLVPAETRAGLPHVTVDTVTLPMNVCLDCCV